MPKKNVDLMLQVRDQITRDPDSHDQGVWFHELDNDCGTVGCIAGWAAHFSGAEMGVAGVFADDRYIRPYAQEVLGITTGEASELFYAENREALTLLDEYIEEGKNDG